MKLSKESCKTLFDADDVPDFVPVLKSSKVKYQGATDTALMERYSKCSEIIGRIHPGESIHYVSMADWSMHDMIKVIVNQIGKSRVYIATWSASEPGINALLRLCEADLIESLHAVFDWRIKVRQPEAYQLVKYQFNKIYLTCCHAKVTVIQNDAWNISIVGSANITNNPRIEAGVITESKEVADFHQRWIMQVISKANPFRE